MARRKARPLSEVYDAKRRMICCRDCHEWKPLSQFPKAHHKTATGRHTICKPCNIERNRWGAVLRTFGITKEQYDVLLEAQRGVCAICKQPPQINAKATRLAVDHDHTTGRVRGLLCVPCNAAIGALRDDPTLLRRAAAYLEGW